MVANQLGAGGNKMVPGHNSTTTPVLLSNYQSRRYPRQRKSNHRLEIRRFFNQGLKHPSWIVTALFRNQPFDGGNRALSPTSVPIGYRKINICTVADRGFFVAARRFTPRYYYSVIPAGAAPRAGDSVGYFRSRHASIPPNKGLTREMPFR